MASSEQLHPDRSAPPTTPGEVEPVDEATLEQYNRVAETVGLVPSLRMKDNVVQAIAVVVTAVIGLGVGWLITRDVVGLMLGAIGGLVGGLLVSGVVLMVLGWVRAARARNRH